MAVDYTNIATEVLGQMMQAAKQSQGVAFEQFTALQKAVDARKQQLEERLGQVGGSEEEKKLRLKLYQDLMALEPDNYAHYYLAGRFCRSSLKAYREAVAYHTAALQLVNSDSDDLCNIYEERARSFLGLKDFTSALADGKLALRFRYLNKIDLPEKSYKLTLSVICKSLRQLGQANLADELEIVYAFAEVSAEGITDQLIEEFFPLLQIPCAIPASTLLPHAAQASVPTSRMSAIKQAIAHDPVEVQKRQLRSQFFQEHEWAANCSVMLPMMRQLITLAPTNYRYHAAAGDLCIKLHDFAAASAYYTAALALVEQYPGDTGWRLYTRPEHTFRLYRKRAYVAVQRKAYQQALTDYELALRLKPDAGRAIMSAIIACLQKLGYHQQADAVTKGFVRHFATEPYEEEEYMQVEVVAGTDFVEFSEVGTEEGEWERRKQREQAAFERWATPKERQEKEQQALAARHTIEELLNLMHQPIE